MVRTLLLVVIALALLGTCVAVRDLADATASCVEELPAQLQRNLARA
jgi:hypothetical protein